MIAILDLLDSERRLAVSYVPQRRSPALAALWVLDARIGSLLAGTGDPRLLQIKLAWWREAIEALDSGTVPPEPVLAGLAEHVLPLGVSGGELAELTMGWEHLATDGALSDTDLAGFAALRGGVLFRFSARLLGIEPAAWVERAGEAWALVDLARKSSSEPEARRALEAAAERLGGNRSWPRALRPLGMLAMLARRDAERGIGRFEPQGSPRRMLRMLGYWLTGR